LLCGRFLEDSGADDGFSKFRVVGLEGASAGLLRCIGLGGAHVCGVLVVVCVAHCILIMMVEKGRDVENREHSALCVFDGSDNNYESNMEQLRIRSKNIIRGLGIVEPQL
jgi:hypothetical protein